MENEHYTIESFQELYTIPKFEFILSNARAILLESNIKSKKLILDFQLIPDIEPRLSEISKHILKCTDEYLNLFRQFRISKEKNFITPIIEKLIGINPNIYIGISNDIIEFDVMMNLKIKDENSIMVLTHYLLMLLYNDGAIEYFSTNNIEPDETQLYLHSLGNTFQFPKKLIALLIAYRTLLLEKEANSTPPEQTPQTKPKGKVTFVWLKNDESRDLLYKLLTQEPNPYIDKNYTSIEAFREVFNAIPIDNTTPKIKWLRNKNELQYLLKDLNSKSIFSAIAYWEISQLIFVNETDNEYNFDDRSFTLPSSTKSTIYEIIDKVEKSFS